MVASSYPRFPGDTVGTFMEPIARGVAGRGHRVHLVLPWHPRWARPACEHGVTFHLFRYAPSEGFNVFGYAGSLRADVSLRGRAVLASPLALVSGWHAARRVAREVGATVMHGHWVVPGGAIAAAAAPGLPLVVSLHGSDAYMAERHRAIGLVAGWTLRRAGFVTSCSDDLRLRANALGADPARSATVPYGVDAARFRPNPSAGAVTRAAWGVAPGAKVVFAAGRFVRKKGFEYLIDAVASLVPTHPALVLVLAGGGDLDAEFRDRLARLGVAGRAVLTGVLSHDEVAAGLAAADVAVIPSVKDDAGNVDGLPNVVMEAMASGTPLIATSAGGIGSVVVHERTGLLVGERDVTALRAAIARVLANPGLGRALGGAARERVLSTASWDLAAESFEHAYDRAASRARR